jgi:hypothetical protein
VLALQALAAAMPSNAMNAVALDLRLMERLVCRTEGNIGLRAGQLLMSYPMKAPFPRILSGVTACIGLSCGGETASSAHSPSDAAP